MFSNYVKVAVRNLLRYKGYSLITIVGLAIGMASSILILLWVLDELSYNSFNENIDRVCLVPQVQHYETTGDFPVSPTPMALAEALKADVPGIQSSTRYEPWLGTRTIVRGKKSFDAEIHFADPSFFDIFTFHFIRGNRKTALDDPHSIVLTVSSAKRMFGEEDPLGKTVTMDNKVSLTVTGILEDVPHNSDIRFEGLAPTSLLKEYHVDTAGWGSNMIMTYVLLRDPRQMNELSASIKDFMKKKAGPERGTLFLFPLSDLHLYSIKGSGGRINQLIIFSIVAFFTLFIACINFVNLATARSTRRSVEVGVRKVVGASRRQLAIQFFTESAVLMFISLALALLVVEIFLPYFNGIADKNLRLQDVGLESVLLIVGLVTVTGLFAGMYPALFLSAFKPTSLVKKMAAGKPRVFSLRTSLVVLQFAISISLIVGTLIINSQLKFIENKDIGIQRSNVLYFSLTDNLRSHIDNVKTELLRNPDILSVSATSNLPLFIYSNGGGWSWAGKPPDRNELVSVTSVDDDYLSTFGIKLKEGRFYSKDRPGDGSSSIVINERFAKLMGDGSAVGKEVTRGDYSATVVGVVKDFNFINLHNEIGPLAILLNKNWNVLSLRVAGNKLDGTIAYIRRVVQAADPSFVFQYQWLDQSYREMYTDEQRLEDMINSFALLAILISCLGLYGVTLHAVETRTKEIGIRKVCGASAREIIVMLSGESLRWMVLANAIAWPVAYYFMHNWLQKFAYRTDPGIDVFLLAGGITLAIALLTIGYQALRAAMSNPVEALRYE